MEKWTKMQAVAIELRAKALQEQAMFAEHGFISDPQVDTHNAIKEIKQQQQTKIKQLTQLNRLIQLQTHSAQQ